jgi:4-hydroxy-3-methylbut-2-enyl diphosphate reductase IspH
MNQKVIYEPHPVSPERKKALREQGYKIVDAVFDPNPKPAKAARKSEADKSE